MKHQDHVLPPAQTPTPRASPPLPSLYIFNSLGDLARNAAPPPPPASPPSPSCSFQRLPKIPLQVPSCSTSITPLTTQPQHYQPPPWSVCPLHRWGALGSVSHHSSAPPHGHEPAVALPRPSFPAALPSGLKATQGSPINAPAFPAFFVPPLQPLQVRICIF